ncbi:hypothetical protein T4A_1224 [Trichinella pseudospiralis]|uniref:Uncharacterized protein n=1 Tax=Trichinella pseudospiralis TaxID=6337 RepID=A0A0V1EK96_TRIPS|nr:hypothetical protein T4A_1224 [Trichinella pseudospiralis]
MYRMYKNSLHAQKAFSVFFTVYFTYSKCACIHEIFIYSNMNSSSWFHADNGFAIFYNFRLLQEGEGLNFSLLSCSNARLYRLSLVDFSQGVG